MSTVRLTWARTIGRSRSLCSNAVLIGGFLAATAVLFAFNLESAEGGLLSLASVWAVSVAPFLPALAAFVAMDVWSDERQTGRLDILLSSPVTEGELTFGKFLGVFSILAFSVLLSLFVTLGALRFFAPSAFGGTSFASLGVALFALLLQGFLWCAISVSMSALFSPSAVAASVSLILLVGLPRGGWFAAMAWAPQGRTAFGEMPFDAQVLDMAAGVFSSGVILSYLMVAGLFLFAASRFILLTRFRGRGGRGLRGSTVSSIFLAIVLTALAVMAVNRLDVKLDFPVATVESGFSPRMRNILSEARGELSITCFLSRSDARFRPLGRFLRALKRESESLGGVAVDLRFVDPRWDVGAAERLVRSGAPEESLFFEKGRRTAVLPLADGYGERICASTILRLTMPPQHRNVYWTIGHGETLFDAYGAWGMSDIARDLAREGYRNQVLDLTGDAAIPFDCALIVVAGARSDFSHVEIARIDAYLKGGGRLLTLLSTAESGGVVSLLPSWGLRPAAVSLSGARTLSGTDVIVSDFSEHVISRPLTGSRIVLERPIGFMPSAAAESGSGADQIEFTPLARVGSVAVAAAVERGVGAGEDLSIRPTRIVALGDTLSVLNGQLAARANANRDFFLNCVAWLSGTDAAIASGAEAAALTTGLDRSARIRFVTVTAIVLPVMIFILLFMLAFRRRRRS